MGEAEQTAGKRPSTVRVAQDGDQWLFAGRRRRLGDSGVVVHPDDLSACTCTDLKRAMRLAVTANFLADTVLVSTTTEAFMDEDGAPASPVSFELRDGELMLRVQFFSDLYDDEGLPPSLDSLLAPLLKRQHLTLAVAYPDPNWRTPPWLWYLVFGASTRSRTLEDLHAAGREVLSLLEAASDGTLTRETVGDLVRGGQATALIGQPEGHWLDVKAQHYDLGTPRGRISLAQSVARFANAEDGGIVVVGMNTKRIPGGEEIRSVCPVPSDGSMPRRYQQALDEHLYPPLEGVTIDAIDHAGGMLMVVEVPPQPEELKPFLVHGAIVDGTIEGAFISIVRRRGEASIPITAPMIHASLAAGRALLRGPHRPSVKD